MNFGYRDWRVIARFRGLPGLKSRRELRQALLLQMTPTELDSYHDRHHRLMAIMLVLAAGFALIAPPPRMPSQMILVCRSAAG